MGNDFSSCSLNLSGPERFFNFINNAPFYIRAGQQNCIFTGAQAEAILMLFSRARRALTNPPWAPAGTRFKELATTGAFRDTYWEIASTALEFDTVQGMFDVGLEGTGFPAFQNLPLQSQQDNASAILLMVFLIRTMSADRASGFFSLMSSNLGRFVFRRITGNKFGGLDTNLFSAFFQGSLRLNILGNKAVSVNGRSLVVGAQPFILQQGALVQLVPMNVCNGIVQGVDYSGPIIEAGPFGVKIDGGVYMSLNEGQCILCRPLIDIPIGLQRLLDYIGLPFEDYSVQKDDDDSWRDDDDTCSSSSDSPRAGIQNIPLFGNYNGRGVATNGVYEPVEENFLGPQVPYRGAATGGFGLQEYTVPRGGGCFDGACYNSDKGGLDFSVGNQPITVNTSENVDDLLRDRLIVEDNDDKGKKRRKFRDCRNGNCRRKECRICGDCPEPANCGQLRQRNTLFAYLKNINRITSNTQYCLKKLISRIGTGANAAPLFYGQRYDRLV